LFADLISDDMVLMTQVYWYTALLALTPQPPNADAFTGMAIGAAVGGYAWDLQADGKYQQKLMSVDACY
jgi:hypothetical protein